MCPLHSLEIYMKKKPVQRNRIVLMREAALLPGERTEEKWRSDDSSLTSCPGLVWAGLGLLGVL